MDTFSIQDLANEVYDRQATGDDFREFIKLLDMLDPEIAQAIETHGLGHEVELLGAMHVRYEPGGMLHPLPPEVQDRVENNERVYSLLVEWGHEFAKAVQKRLMEAEV